MLLKGIAALAVDLWDNSLHARRRAECRVIETVGGEANANGARDSKTDGRNQ